MDPMPILSCLLVFLGTHLKGHFTGVVVTTRVPSSNLEHPAPRWFALRETRKSDDRHQAPVPCNRFAYQGWWQPEIWALGSWNLPLLTFIWYGFIHMSAGDLSPDFWTINSTQGDVGWCFFLLFTPKDPSDLGPGKQGGFCGPSK